MAAYFNVTIFCDLQGHYHDLSVAYNLLFTILFLFIGVLIIICSGYVLFVGIWQSKKLQDKQNTFVLSLIISDFLFGAIFIPIFLIELWSRVLKYNGDYCSIRSWRVISFTYLFSCRLLSIVFISVYTYIRANKSKTRIEEVFSKLVRILTIFVIWITPAAVLLSIAFAEPENYKVVGTVTYVYYFVSISITIISYLLTYLTIRSARKRHENALYEKAVDFLKGILIWFLMTTLLLGACGLALVVLAHDTKLNKANAVLEHHLYITAIFICTLDAIANPIVYLRKFKRSEDNHDMASQTVSTRLYSTGTRNTGYISNSPKLCNTQHVAK